MSSMYDRTYLVHNAGVKDASKAKMVEVLKRLILHVDGKGGADAAPTLDPEISFIYDLSCEALGVPSFPEAAPAEKAPTDHVNGSSSKVAEAIIETGRPGI
jgi:hypothetical protein